MADTFDFTALAQHWVHSHEEDHDGIIVFRLASYTFPPSRGREQLDLRKAGQVNQETNTPTDRRTQKQGSWKVDNGLLEITIEGATRTWRVVEVSPVRLMLKRL